MIAFILVICLTAAAEIKTPLFSITIDINPQQMIHSASLLSLMQKNQVNKVHLMMGHLTHKQPKLLAFPSTNIAHIYSKEKLSQSTIQQIASVFGVSQSSTYVLQQPQFNLTTVADPNDRLCMEHFQTLIRQFLPCKNWAQVGLQHLYGFDKLFKGFLGLQFIWQMEKVHFRIVAEREKRQILQSFQKNTICGSIVQSEYTIQGNESEKILQSITIRRFSLSKWYHPSKTIGLSIHQSQQTHIKNGSLQIINRLPSGFDINEIACFPQSVQYTTKIQQKERDSIVHISFDLPLQMEEILIHIQFTAGFPSIERFQSIAGGGQEIMGLNRIIIDKKVYQIPANPVSESLLQPDFSIAFKAITGGVAVILLVWLTLWRNHQLQPYSSILDKQE